MALQKCELTSENAEDAEVTCSALKTFSATSAVKKALEQLNLGSFAVPKDGFLISSPDG
jgi:hypothetical protein